MPLIHIARWDNFGYGGINVDRGQIIEMKGLPNDEKLLRLGYITQVDERKPTILECGECGARFMDDASRDAHGRRRHPRRQRRHEFAQGPIVDPTTGEPTVMIDNEGDREERQRERDTPLYLDKTAASAKG